MTRQRPRTQRGQELAEYALVLPIFLFIVFAIFDLGRAVYYYSAMQNSAREGTRYGVIYPEDAAGIHAIVVDRAIGLDPARLSVTVTLLEEDDAIQVEMTYQYQPVTPFIPDLLGAAVIPLHTQSTMLAER